jgi:hypothetical protein
MIAGRVALSLIRIPQLLVSTTRVLRLSSSGLLSYLVPVVL